MMKRRLPDEVTPANFSDAMAQAIGIEIATIPVYLYGYYSIIRTPCDVTDEIEAKLIAQGMPTAQAADKAKSMNADIAVFSNKAAAMVVSVAMEEMLHMSLSANVSAALGYPPQLVRQPTNETGSPWPVQLPGHEPPFDISLEPFSLDMLETWLKIESPYPFDKTLQATEEAAIEYTTIGQFYEMIEQCILEHYASPDKYGDAPQLVPNRGYYAQNNINTAYYNRVHEPRFVNAADSGDLIHVVDCKSAIKALQIIVHQGEGSSGMAAGGLLGWLQSRSIEAGAPFPRDFDPPPPAPHQFDDPARKERSHYDKFYYLWWHLLRLELDFKTAFDDPTFDVKQWFVQPVAKNPTTADYPLEIKAVSDLTNAVYWYTFIMAQSCYQSEGDTPFEVFMAGVHKSMMWILGSLCEHMVGYGYTAADGTSRHAAPTFERWTFRDCSSPKCQLIELWQTAQNYKGGLDSIGARILSLPDVSKDGFTNPNQPILTTQCASRG